MLTKSQAIVLSSLKYGDSDLIVKCFTLQRGTTSYLLKGILKATRGKLKAAYFQPLTLLSLDETIKSKSSLQGIKEVKIDYHYTSLHTNMVKSSITLFLSEVLSIVLKEEGPQEDLFHFLSTSMQVLDQEEKVSNFHLLFLVKLTKYLGISPDNLAADKPFFNLKDGKFETVKTDAYSVEGKTVEVLKILLTTNLDTVNNIKINTNQRQVFLNTMLFYYELHIPGFKKPKSLEVLNKLFN